MQKICNKDNLKRFLIFLVIFCTICIYLFQKNTKIAVEATDSSSEYFIYIDAESCYLYLFKNGEIFRTYECASGKNSTPSPIGNWFINKKSTWGEGFGGHWMGLSCPWGKFGIHGTTHPESIGNHASGGCIRLLNKNATELYSIVPLGTLVTVTDGPFGQFGKGFRTIKTGMYGSDVMAVQKRLKELKLYVGLCNGKYETRNMINAVHKFQEQNNLKVSDMISKEMMRKLGFFLFE